MIRKLPVIASGLGLLISIILCSVEPAHTGEQDLICPSCSLKPTLRAGYVYEFTQIATTYRGFEIAGQYSPGPWVLSARYQADYYVMPYFGMTWQTFQQIMQNQTLTSMPFTRYDAVERKSETELMAGRRFWNNTTTLLAGARILYLNNDFSAMKTTGPSVRMEQDLPFLPLNMFLKLDGAWYMRAVVDNKHDFYEFVLPDGERTISFYGEPRYSVGWHAAIAPHSGIWRRLFVGYDGSMIGLKYGYRYYHGVSIGAAF